jgi:hypothetical protein
MFWPEPTGLSDDQLESKRDKDEWSLNGGKSKQMIPNDAQNREDMSRNSDKATG